MTVPSIGEMMSVYERFVCAWCSCASFCATDGRGDVDLRRADLHGRLRAVDVLLRGQVLLEQALLARELLHGEIGLRLRALEPRLGRRVVRARLLDRRLEEERVDLGDELALLDRRVVVRQELLDPPGDLGADGHRDGRQEGPGRRDATHDVPAREGRRLVGHRRRLMGLPVSPGAHAGGGDEHERCDPGDDAESGGS